MVAPGALASFMVVAANSRNIFYQWRFNGADLTGANNDTLLLQNVGTINEGQYSVVLTNISGSVTSAPALLMLDGDRDGLPDSWELASFGNLNQYPTGDLDGDGVSNRDELLDGTNPADSASVLFRLKLLSDGGQVVVNPSRFTFTSGEIVTLTASALAPGSFHGWTGDTNTTNPTISLVMTNHKTVFAHLGVYDLTWTNAVSGDWNVASNWSPNFVPGTNDNVFITSSVTVTLNTNAACGSLTLSAGTLAGSGALTLHRDSAWSGGTMTGSGRTIIPQGATLTITGGAVALTGGRILDNGGTTFWNSGNIQSATATVITNRPGALFQVQSAATITAGAGGGRFDNAGTFRKTSAGTTTINTPVSINNYGAVELQSGILAASGGYNSTANSLLHCAIGGTTAGAGYGRLQVAGTVTLNGALSVTLTNGFVPAVNDAFTILSAGTRNGTFASFAYPSTQVVMQMNNTANSVVVGVSEVLVVPQPILLMPERIGANIQLIWTTVSNTTYRLEFNPDLNPTNWTGLAGDILSLSNTVSRLETLPSSNRFYRVRVVP